MASQADNIGVSVIIPAKNEERFIEKCLSSLIEGTSPEFKMEIVVVDAMSTDATRTIVEKISQKHPFVKCIDNPDIETQKGLNKGIKQAAYPWVMIAGAHAAYPKGYIENVYKKIVALSADGAGGMLHTDVLNKNKRSLSICQVLSHPVGVGNSMFRIGAKKPVKVDTVPFGIYKKSLFDEVGYYDERLKRNQDIEWSRRLKADKKNIYLIPDMACTYYARENFKSLAVNNFNNGLWNLMTVFLTRNLKSLSIRHFMPFAFLSFLVLTALAGLFYTSLWFLGLFVVALYLVVIAIAALSIKTKSKGTSFLYLCYAFMVLHFSYAVGSFIGLLKITGRIFKK